MKKCVGMLLVYIIIPTIPIFVYFFDPATPT